MNFSAALRALAGRSALALKDYGGSTNDDNDGVGGNCMIGGHGLGVIGGNDTGDDEVAQTDGVRPFWRLKFIKGAAVGVVAVSGLVLFGGGAVVISRGDGGAAAVSASTSSSALAAAAAAAAKSSDDPSATSEERQQRRHLLLEAGGSPEGAGNLAGQVADLSVDDAAEHSPAARHHLHNNVGGRSFEGSSTESTNVIAKVDDSTAHVRRLGDQYVSSSGKRFFRIEGKMNYMAAREKCLAFPGFDLAKIVTKEENAMAAKACGDSKNNRSFDPLCWIGLNDKVEESSFTWADGEAFGTPDPHFYGSLDPDYSWANEQNPASIFSGISRDCTYIYGESSDASTTWSGSRLNTGNWLHFYCSNADQYPLCSTQVGSYSHWDKKLKTDGTQYVIQSVAHDTYIRGWPNEDIVGRDGQVDQAHHARGWEKFTFEPVGTTEPDNYYIKSVAFGTYISYASAPIRTVSAVRVDMSDEKTLSQQHIIKLHGSASSTGRHSYSISWFGAEDWYLGALNDGASFLQQSYVGSYERFYIKAVNEV